MLKDITLGQYFPGSSIIHRLDPRAKLIMLVVYIVALFMAVSWISYAVCLLFFSDNIFTCQPSKGLSNTVRIMVEAVPELFEK